jgi:hypothetical protein
MGESPQDKYKSALLERYEKQMHHNQGMWSSKLDIAPWYAPDSIRLIIS